MRRFLAVHLLLAAADAADAAKAALPFCSDSNLRTKQHSFAEHWYPESTWVVWYGAETMRFGKKTCKNHRPDARGQKKHLLAIWKPSEVSNVFKSVKQCAVLKRPTLNLDSLVAGEGATLCRGGLSILPRCHRWSGEPDFVNSQCGCHYGLGWVAPWKSTKHWEIGSKKTKRTYENMWLFSFGMFSQGAEVTVRTMKTLPVFESRVECDSRTTRLDDSGMLESGIAFIHKSETEAEQQSQSLVLLDDFRPLAASMLRVKLSKPKEWLALTFDLLMIWKGVFQQHILIRILSFSRGGMHTSWLRSAREQVSMSLECIEICCPGRGKGSADNSEYNFQGCAAPFRSFSGFRAVGLDGSRI